MTDEIENFNFAEIFDENTVKIFNQYVNVEKILENRRENAAQKERRMAEKAKEEEMAKIKVEDNGNSEKAENGEKENENGPPAKRSKKSEKRGQNKKRKHTGLFN